ncbi:hypothetical protein BGW39_007757 [Mortierella sp. 14UC]|nr:hypothetical protein BGW39_007757 [Mortierella sp. 14UC]
MVVVGSEQDVGGVRLEDSTEYSPVETVVLSADPSLLQQQQEEQRQQRKEENEVDQLVRNLKEDEMVGETVEVAMAAALAEHFGIVDDEGLAIFILDFKHVDQDAEVVSLLLVLDVPGEAAIPKYESLPEPTIDHLLPPPADAQQEQPPLHTKHHWTGCSIQMALDPNFQDPADAPPRPRPQDKGDQVSRLEIVQWQQEQDLSECRGRNDGYEHEIDELRHVVEEQDSDLKELRRLVEELKEQAAAIEAELE